MIIRKETKDDYKISENLTREAFWNFYNQGCDEHYYLNKLRSHPEFIDDLALLLEVDGEIVGNIYCVENYIIALNSTVQKVASFGPISISPNKQKLGYGEKLISYTIDKVKKLGYSAIIICGNPNYYKKYGFINSRTYYITNCEGRYPLGLLVLKLNDNLISGKFTDSFNYQPNIEEIEKFDLQFAPKIKKYKPSQDEFVKIATAYLD